MDKEYIYNQQKLWPQKHQFKIFFLREHQFKIDTETNNRDYVSKGIWSLSFVLNPLVYPK